jgi:hypothetical protein
MAFFTVKELKKKFMKFVDSEEFPDTLIDWHEYDGQTRQVFVWIEGEWNKEIKAKIENYLKTFHRKLLLSRMIRVIEEENDDEDYI